MDVDQSTFCAAPWFTVRTSNQGEFVCCCDLDRSKTNFTGNTHFKWPDSQINEWLNSDYNIYLKENLSKGVKLPECHKCWKKEANNGSSTRKNINRMVNNYNNFNSGWLNTYFKQKSDYTHNLIYAFDIKISNLCNYRCVMCNPSDSSKIYLDWYKTKDHPMIQKRLTDHPMLMVDSRNVIADPVGYDFLKYALSCRPKVIKLLGGEPLIDNNMLEILKDTSADVASTISLHFTTNGSVDLVSIVKQLKHFKSVIFAISLEGIGPVHEWARKGSNWTFTEANIKKFIQEYGVNNIHVHHVVQALTLFHSMDLVNWVTKQNINIDFGILGNPLFLSLNAIPDSLKSKILKNVSGHTVLSSLLTTSKFDTNLLNDLTQWVQWYDPEQQYQTILPEWAEYVK